MKKSLVMATTLAVLFCAASVHAAPCPLASSDEAQKPQMQKIHKPISPEKKAQMEKRKAEFDKKLNLTEEQKTKAEAIRKDGFEKMKPVMEQMKVKRDEIRAIREDGKLTQAEAKAKIDVIHKDMIELKKQAAEIRKQNMAEFEAILTDKQKKTLEKMKQEGRKDFAKRHNGEYRGDKKGCKGTPPAVKKTGCPLAPAASDAK